MNLSLKAFPTIRKKLGSVSSRPLYHCELCLLSLTCAWPWHNHLKMKLLTEVFNVCMEGSVSYHHPIIGATSPCQNCIGFSGALFWNGEYPFPLFVITISCRSLKIFNETALSIFTHRNLLGFKHEFVGARPENQLSNKHHSVPVIIPLGTDVLSLKLVHTTLYPEGGFLIWEIPWPHVRSRSRRSGGWHTSSDTLKYICSVWFQAATPSLTKWVPVTNYQRTRKRTLFK